MQPIETKEKQSTAEKSTPEQNRYPWIWIILLLGILMVAAYFRFVGLNWDASQHQHPDERFMTMVASALQTPNDLGQYFNTAVSPLNPNNMGYGFYVYGDLPLFIVRYLAGWLEQTGYDQVFLVGRVVSGTLDLLTIILIYLMADLLFKNKRLALLAAAFDALAVLQIQLSHFFTVDIPSNFFIFLAFYVALHIQTSRPEVDESVLADHQPFWRRLTRSWRSAIPYALFGLMSGMALSSKISAYPLVLLLPAAAYVWWDRLDRTSRDRIWPLILRNLAIGGFFCLLAFRVFQPYAFQGPGLLGIGLNPKWVDNMQQIQAQINNDVDAPFALQWIRRPVTFAWTNMVQWGLGIPLGLLAWAGFLLMAWRMIRGEWRKYLILWGWTAGFFTWQSLQGNPSMRYQIPVYPTLAIIAAWAVFQLWHSRPAWLSRLGRIPWQKVIAFGLGLGVLGATFAWALAFSQVYVRPETRVAATSWIYQNIPGPINLHIQGAGSTYNQPLTYEYNTSIQQGAPFVSIFSVSSPGSVTEFDLPALATQILDLNPIQLNLQVSDVDNGGLTIASGSLQVPAKQADPQAYQIPLDHIIQLEPGHRYGLTIQAADSKSIVQISAPVQFTLYSQYEEQSLGLDTQQLQLGKPVNINFTAQQSGTLLAVHLPLDTQSQDSSASLTFTLGVTNLSKTHDVGGTSFARIQAASNLDSATFTFDPAISLQAQQKYMFSLQQDQEGSPILASGDLQITLAGNPEDVILPFPVRLLREGEMYVDNFTAQSSGLLGEIYFPYMADEDPTSSGSDRVTVSLMDATYNTVMASGTVERDLRPSQDPKGQAVTVKLDKAVQLEQGTAYSLRVVMESGGALALRGSSPANESSWDDGLPLRMDNYDGYSGIYQPGLNFEMYWDDNAAKLTRFEDTLSQSDYIFITSNRQWGSIPRVQERYPLSTAYYRDLLGCPPEKNILWCYAVAEPGMFQGKLGFQLVKVFESYPNLGSTQFNDQLAEEAFTVYDHQKVMIFKKTAGYSSQNVADLLGSVDLSTVVHVTPKTAPRYPANIMLPDYLQAQQQAGGTWSDLFNRDALINLYPVLTVIFWYLAVALLGWVVYPFIRLALGRLPDHGYPLARVSGMVILAYLVWVAGSGGIPFTQGTIAVVFLGLILVNGGLAYWQRAQLKAEWTTNRRYFIAVELITLAFFLLDLGIRLGNPDLWHPYKGGEKPMDFSYLNAVLKSTSFPPYDPWFGGGYINYYYYGFVLIGTIIKGLGVVPTVAYNLALPSLFAMVAMGAFSIGWNLLGGKRHAENDGSAESQPPVPRILGIERRPLLAGISASVGMLILGNLGTVKMIWEGFQRLVVSQDVMDAGNIFQRMIWMFEGIAKFLGGANLPYGIGEWYWNPSRAIPLYAGNPITEFPFFTFLYADPHAHLIALPVTLLALAWALSIVKGAWRWSSENEGRWGVVLRFGASLLLGGLAIGALRPTNTWDMPAYLGLGILAVLYSAIRYGQIPAHVLPVLSPLQKRVLVAIGSAVLLIALSFVLYQPFSSWYDQGYNALDPYTGDRTPMWAYTMHWGVFLFIIATWFVIETLDWLSKTPVSALNRLRPYRMHLIIFSLAYLALAVVLSFSIPIAWLVLLLALWAAVLIFRPGQPDAKRAVLVMIGLALVLTLAVEVVVLRGDVDRMNTVFKFYLQAWTLFSIGAAAALWWLLPAAAPLWTINWRRAWLTAASLLVFGAALFPLFGGTDKIRDRMSVDAPHTLDGMTYMATSFYSDPNGGVTLDLSPDYRAILWMQENVKGSPVIVEANTPEYRWGSRFTIYTGLPGVVGWNWHQRQQRGVANADWVQQRVDEITNFYQTTDLQVAEHFLDIYNVKYIIVGSLEQLYYPGPGLAKFTAQDGILWKAVYRDINTVVYEVIK